MKKHTVPWSKELVPATLVSVPGMGPLAMSSLNLSVITGSSQIGGRGEGGPHFQEGDPAGPACNFLLNTHDDYFLSF